MINVSTDIANAISSNTASMISQLWIVFAVLFAIIITFYIARKIIFTFSLTKRQTLARVFFGKRGSETIGIKIFYVHTTNRFRRKYKLKCYRSDHLSRTLFGTHYRGAFGGLGRWLFDFGNLTSQKLNNEKEISFYFFYTDFFGVFFK